MNKPRKSARKAIKSSKTRYTERRLRKMHKKTQRKNKHSRRTRSHNRYSGAWGDGCGINSIIEGDKTSSDDKKKFGKVFDKKENACYKPCDLTEISHPYSCEHVGIVPGGQYKYIKNRGALTMDDHMRPRVPVPRGKDFTEKEKQDIEANNKLFQEFVVKAEGWKEFDNTNLDTSSLNFVNVAKGVGAVASGALAVAGGVVGGAIGAAKGLALGLGKCEIGKDCFDKVVDKVVEKSSKMANQLSSAGLEALDAIHQSTIIPSTAPAHIDAKVDAQVHSHPAEYIVAAEHALHLPTPPTVHMTPQEQAEEKKLESEDIISIIKPEFTENKGFKDEVQKDDAKLFKALDDLTKPGHAPAPAPAHPEPAHAPTPAPAPVSDEKSKADQAAKKRNDYCKANPNDKQVPKNGSMSCADYCAKPDSNCVVPKVKK